jgi:hypothetical protein
MHCLNKRLRKRQWTKCRYKAASNAASKAYQQVNQQVKHVSCALGALHFLNKTLAKQAVWTIAGIKQQVKYVSSE